MARNSVEDLGKASYSLEDLEKLVCQVERAATKVDDCKHSAVRLRASERDLLSCAENLRDLCIRALKGNKALLNEVFGGDCVLLGRTYVVLESVQLSDMHVTDQRWSGLKMQLEAVKQVLLSLGTFRPFVKVSQEPQNLRYPKCRSRFTPGERITLQPAWEGADPTSFKISPNTPFAQRLRLHQTTGVISGQLMAGVELAETKYEIIAENRFGQTTCTLEFSVLHGPPTGIDYAEFPSGKVLFLGESMKVRPTVREGKATSWEVDPPLPLGLRLKPESGRIYGIPREEAPLTSYKVTAANEVGKGSVNLSFAVAEAAPVELTYPDFEEEYPCGSAVYLMPAVELQKNKGVRCSSLSTEECMPVPDGEHSTASDARVDGSLGSVGTARKSSSSGKRSGLQRRNTNTFELLMDKPSAAVALPVGLEFTCAPELPAGLHLSSAMGVISGRPSAPAAAQTYLITAKNCSGEATVTLDFAVIQVPPSDLHVFLPEDHPGFFVGEPVSLQPTVCGGIDEWSLEGRLPAGLDFNASMGIIEGIPAEEGAFEVTVRAKNTEGECSFDWAFAIQKAPPSSLSFPDEIAKDYPLGRCMNLTPAVDGSIEEWTITPPLPDGLALDARTGVIEGTPAAESPETEYTLTAKNSSGEASIPLTFAVKLLPPTALVYPSIDEAYYHGEEMSIEPTVEGGASAWAIEPDLPPGMVLDGSTGKISGSPLQTSEETTYVVTVSNEAGAVSSELTFKVLAPPPSGFSYPCVDEVYSLSDAVCLEPEVGSCVAGVYKIFPALPQGLVLDTKTGTISGQATQVMDKRTYTVTVTNAGGSARTGVKFAVVGKREVVPQVVKVTQEDEKFADLIEGITDLAEVKKIGKANQKGPMSWMIWMVHRAWLNDPELTALNFNQMHMPLPHEEPRVAPKLMQALCHNTYIEQLHLTSANMQSAQGIALAHALRTNSTLTVLGLEANSLDAASISAIAEALKDAGESSVHTIRATGQKVCQHFGGRAEQALAEMIQVNTKIIKLGIPLRDPHWRRVVDQGLIRNMDRFRRQRKAAAGLVDDADQIKPKEVVLSALVLSEVPDQAVYEVFEDDSQKHSLIRRIVAQSKRLPTKEQLQNFAKSCGTPLKFSEVAPMLVDFRKRLLDAFLEKKVRVTTANGEEIEGTLAAHTVKSDNWLLDVWPSDNKRYHFKSSARAPKVEVSPELAEWLSCVASE